MVHVVHHLHSIVLKEMPSTVVAVVVCVWGGGGGGGEGGAETSQNFSYKWCVAFVPCKPKFKGNNCIMCILCPLAQLYTFECMFFG